MTLWHNPKIGALYVMFRPFRWGMLRWARNPPEQVIQWWIEIGPWYFDYAKLGDLGRR